MINGDGYGMMYHKGKMRLAHRVSFCLSNGIDLDEIKGKLVRHKCDTPACYEDDHLCLGTPADNMRDMVERKRHSHGEMKRIAKLTDLQVLGIRRVFSTGCFTKTELAKMYKVSETTIREVVLGANWKHVTGPIAEPKRHIDRPIDFTLIPRKIRHNTSRLTDEDVIAIRSKHASGTHPNELVKEFGVGRSNIYLIVKRRIWRHI